MPLLNGAIFRMTDIASHIFTEENMEFAVHGNEKKFDVMQMKLELLLNALKNNNSRFKDTVSHVEL